MIEKLSPVALVTLEEAKVYLQHATDTLDDEVITRLINYASGAIEKYTARRLRQRIYDGGVGASVVSGVNDRIDINDGAAKVVTVTAAAYASMTLLAAAVETALNVASTLWTCTYSTSTRKFTIARSSGTAQLLWSTGVNSNRGIGLTLGYDVAANDTGSASYVADFEREETPNEAPIIRDGTGCSDIEIPEGPVASVSSAEWISDPSTPTWTALNITGYRVRNGRGSATLYLPWDTFHHGFRNIRITCTAGIAPSSIEWKALSGAALRWVQVLLLDQKVGIGRGTGMSAGGESISLIDQAIPKDIALALEPFRRIL